MGQTVIKGNARKLRRLAKGEVIAQYAPKTPKITVRIAVLVIRKATNNALT